MKKDPFFSVVIPVHNKEPHIKRSIESVLDQTFKNFELIIIDDASSDNSVKEIQKFTDNRIKLYYREESGSGGYAARNFGIEKAKSDWIAFLDADDQWYLNHLNKYKELIKKIPDAKVLGCGWIYHEKEKKSQKYDAYYFNNKGTDVHKLTFNEYLKNEVNGKRPIWTSIACIHKITLIEAGKFPEKTARRGGDVDTWLRCIEKAGGIAWSSHIGAVYYRDAVNMVTRTEKFLAECERTTVKKLLAKYSGEEAHFLKAFANKRTINAWKQNKYLSNTNFHLYNKLYLTVHPFKNIVFLLLSFLPNSIFWNLQELRRNLRKKFKKKVNAH